MSRPAPPIVFFAFANDRVDETRYFFQDVRFRNRVAIFHFGGHAGSGVLLFESPEGAARAAHAGGFARFLGEQWGLALVFLNSCSTQGQVESLLAAGVPAVIATSEDILDAVATELASRFYKALASGAPLRAAFKEAAAAVPVAADDPLFGLPAHAAPIVLLFGVAGAGKSSLLAAGLQPRLEASHGELGLTGTLAQVLPDWRRREERTGKPLIVILDQAEEAWTRPLTGGGEIEAFASVLRALFAVRESRPRGRLILTTRLVHDTLAPLVRRRFEVSELPGQRALRILHDRVADWEEGKTGEPLDELDLARVEKGQGGMRARTPDEERLVGASRGEAKRRTDSKRPSPEDLG